MGNKSCAHANKGQCCRNNNSRECQIYRQQQQQNIQRNNSSNVDMEVFDLSNTVTKLNVKNALQKKVHQMMSKNRR